MKRGLEPIFSAPLMFKACCLVPCCQGRLGEITKKQLTKPIVQFILSLSRGGSISQRRAHNSNPASDTPCYNLVLHLVLAGIARVILRSIIVWSEMKDNSSSYSFCIKPTAAAKIPSGKINWLNALAKQTQVKCEWIVCVNAREGSTLVASTKLPRARAIGSDRT